MDHYVFDGEAGAQKQAEVDGSEIHFAAQRGLERGANTGGESIPAQVRRCNADRQQQDRSDAQPLESTFDDPLHAPLLARRLA